MSSSQKKSYDVIVLGLGGMGSSAAYHLAARGLRVLGLDRNEPVHDRGSSHGHSRVIRQSYFEDPAYVPLLLRAYELWERLEVETGRKLMMLCGGLMMGRPESTVVSGSISSAKEHGVPHQILDSVEIRRRFPQFHPSENEIALYEEKAGWIHPEDSVRAHLERAAALGAELRFNEPVTSWKAEKDGGVSVVTARGQERAEKLVVAPGAWAPEVLAELGLPLQVERQILFWFSPKGEMEKFHESRCPIYLWEGENGTQFYGFPTQAGVPGMKVAFYRMGQIGMGQTCTPDTVDRTVQPREVEAMRSYIRDRVPMLDGDFLDAKTCLYTTTPDENFVIALHPQYKQVAIACGFSGHGYKFASVVGEILADLTETGTTRHSIGLFKPQRLNGDHFLNHPLHVKSTPQ